MKHNFLRRVGASFLALALVLPMAVTNAWADTGDSFQVSIKVPSGVSLDDLRASTTLETEIVGQVANGSSANATITNSKVTYQWRFTGTPDKALTISPSNAANALIKPTEVGTGTIEVTATCSWTETSANGTSTNKSVDSTDSRTVNVTSVPVDSLSLVGYPTTIKDTEPLDLKPYLVFTPSNASNKNVTWSVSDQSVATVSDGVVHPIKPGKVTIYAASQDSQNLRPAVCSLTITDARTPTLTLTPDTVRTLMVGEPFTLTATATPSDAVMQWEVRNKAVAGITTTGIYNQSTAAITALKPGTTQITVTATGTNGVKVSETRTVTVVDPNSMYATSMTASGSTTLSLSSGEKTKLAVNVSPKSANVTWTSRNSAIASVDPTTGEVTAITPGTTTITATALKSGGEQLTVDYTVTVMANATGVQISTRSSDIKSDSNGLYTQFDAGTNGGRNREVSVNVISANGAATNTYIVWNSSDTSIVTVAADQNNSTKAVLTIPIARPAGQATVTATVYDSTTKQPVKVNDEPLTDELRVIISGITLTDTALVMYEGEAKYLTIANSYGEASGTTATSIQWTSSDNSIASMENGTVNASAKGTATITGTTRDGKYTASCKITVTEDKGTIVNAGSANAGNSVKIGTSSVISQINAIARERTGSQMEYLTGIFISPTQGVVYNSYTSEADTGSGVSMTEKYYVNRTTPAKDYIGALSFVPAKTYSGEARISYIGYANGQPVSGVISVNVNGLGENGADVTYTANASEVTFLADDFNTICVNKSGRTLKYVTFTPPQSSVGTLYENYTNATHPGQKVVSTTQYNRNGNPNINSVTFVPASGYSGAAKITYRAVDSNNNTYTGVVTINVNAAASTSDPADIHYTAPQDGWVTFRASDFASASLRVIGEPLSYVRFALPNSSEGTLFYNYRGFGNYDSDVASTTNYYQSGTPSLSSVAFVPATTADRQTAISYTGYSTRGTTFTGTVYVGEGSGTQTNPGTVFYDYTVNSGSSVNLNATAFNNAFRAAMGVDLSYIRFTSLPTSSQGTLRYRTGSSSYYSNVSTSQSFYRIGTTSSALLIGNVSFLANSAYTGVVRIPYTGYDASGRSYAGEITIQVNPNTIYYNGTTANPLRLYSSQISGACGAFASPLAYIEFTSLPSSNAGRMYFAYSGYGTGTQVSAGAKYYATGSPSIDQLSFVPKGRYTGEATASYTAYSTSGERMSGQITFRISAAASSGYFTDMSNYGWAAASVDYLYQNNVTNGMTSTTFGPSLQIRRCDFILMLHRIFNFRGGSAANPGFADVPANSYYAQAVSAAKQMGIVSGDGTNFMPNSAITRQDAMVMVKNAMAAAGKIQGTASTTILNSFPDGGSVSSYARDAVSTLVQMGAVNGSNGMLNPRMSITRAEAAVILHFIMTV